MPTNAPNVAGSQQEADEGHSEPLLTLLLHCCRLVRTGCVLRCCAEVCHRISAVYDMHSILPTKQKHESSTFFLKHNLCHFVPCVLAVCSTAGLI